MSGIYIPGLRDLSCDDCFWGIGSRLGCHASPEAVTRKINGRAADCPLVFLEDHGRLVDADKMLDRPVPVALGRDRYFLMPLDYVDEVRAAPTVIPADKEAEK